jgi:hypothetical protein
MALASLGALRGEDTMAALRGAQEAAERAGFGLLEAWAYLTITNALEGAGRSELAIQVGREGLTRARQLGLEILDEVLGLNLSPLGRFGPSRRAPAARADQLAGPAGPRRRTRPAGAAAYRQHLLDDSQPPYAENQPIP